MYKNNKTKIKHHGSSFNSHCKLNMKFHNLLKNLVEVLEVLVKCSSSKMLLMSVEFLDLGFSGSPITWQKHFKFGHSIWERLDRALASNDWFLKKIKKSYVNIISEYHSAFTKNRLISDNILVTFETLYGM